MFQRKKFLDSKNVVQLTDISIKLLKDFSGLFSDFIYGNLNSYMKSLINNVSRVLRASQCLSAQVPFECP